MHSLLMKAIAAIAVVVAISFILVIFNFAIIALVLNTAGFFACIFYLNTHSSVDKGTNDTNVIEQASHIDLQQHIKAVKNEFVTAFNMKKRKLIIHNPVSVSIIAARKIELF
ncbi:hypothetical protein [Glaciecola sp. MF2-115]|uniref:hypothetical protein n=1 Tax=Glaciecola sp. MF2-115 TaxID=3384827 RepID=UPI0039A32B95